MPEGSERAGAVPGVAVEVEAVQPGRVEEGGEVRGREVGDAVAVQLAGGREEQGSIDWMVGSLDGSLHSKISGSGGNCDHFI